MYLRRRDLGQLIIASLRSFSRPSFIDFSTSSSSSSSSRRLCGPSTSRLRMHIDFSPELPIRVELDVIPASSPARRDEGAARSSLQRRRRRRRPRPHAGYRNWASERRFCVKRLPDDLWSNNCRDYVTLCCPRRRRRNIWWTQHWSLRCRAADRLHALNTRTEIYIITHIAEY